MAQKIQLNDVVVMISGKQKNKKGKVIKILRNQRKAVVSGVNFVKKHQKPDSSGNKPGKILSMESPVDVSNMAIYNPKTGKPDRIGFKLQNGAKMRFLKSTKSVL